MSGLMLMPGFLTAKRSLYIRTLLDEVTRSEWPAVKGIFALPVSCVSGYILQRFLHGNSLVVGFGFGFGFGFESSLLASSGSSFGLRQILCSS